MCNRKPGISCSGRLDGNCSISRLWLLQPHSHQGQSFPNARSICRVQLAAIHAFKVPLVSTHGFTPHEVSALGELLGDERKHRIVKRYAQDVQNTENCERSILLQVVSHDLALLKHNESYFFETAMLQKQCKPSKKVMDFVKETWGTQVNTCVMCASAKLAPDGVAHKQDVVISKTSPPQVCEVWLFAEVNSEVVAVLSFWTLVKQDVAYSIWHKVDDPKMIPVEEIKCSFSFKNVKDTHFVVILLVHCR